MAEQTPAQPDDNALLDNLASAVIGVVASGRQGIVHMQVEGDRVLVEEQTPAQRMAEIERTLRNDKAYTEEHARALCQLEWLFDRCEKLVSIADDMETERDDLADDIDALFKKLREATAERDDARAENAKLRRVAAASLERAQAYGVLAYPGGNSDADNEWATSLKEAGYGT